MKCPHCSKLDVHPTKSQTDGANWLLSLVACRFRCRKCMHIFHVSKLRALFARSPVTG